MPGTRLLQQNKMAKRIAHHRQDKQKKVKINLKNEFKKALQEASH
jgi:hypothetical protein